MNAELAQAPGINATVLVAIGIIAGIVWFVSSEHDLPSRISATVFWICAALVIVTIFLAIWLPVVL